MKTPKVLDRVADVVLAYKPKPKTKPARKRARRKKALERTVIVGDRGPVECRIRDYE